MMRRAVLATAEHPIIARLRVLDRALAEVGFPPTSEWWMQTLSRFYASGKRQLVDRVGRRGGKSSTFCRIAVCEALSDQHKIPPGDVGVVAIVSVKREEANERIRTVKAILDAIRVGYKPIDGGVAIEGRPVIIRVYTASIAGVSGFTGICILLDEMAKWKDADTGANPAKEVLASIRPTMATQPHARIFLSSSPLGQLDAHARAFADGDTDMQMVAHAPTWVANPSITEASTHKLEPDEARWRREYKAEAMEGDEASLLSAAMLDICTRAGSGDVPRETACSYVAAMDPGFVQNAWTFAIAAKRNIGGKLRKSIVCHREWRGSALAPLRPDDVFAAMAPLCAKYGVTGILSDQYERFSLAAIAEKYGLGVWLPSVNAESRLAMYESLVAEFAAGLVEVPADQTMRADLLAIRQKLTPNGFTIALPVTPDGRHADYAPTVTLALAHCTVDPIVIFKEPAPLTPEWEELRLQREMARIDKFKSHGGLVFDEPPPWMGEQ